MIQKVEKVSIYPEIGKKIKQTRESRKLTQAELAEIVGLNRASVTNIENGKHKIFIHTLVSFCSALELDPKELIPYKKGIISKNEISGENLESGEKEWIENIVKEVQ